MPSVTTYCTDESFRQDLMFLGATNEDDGGQGHIVPSWMDVDIPRLVTVPPTLGFPFTQIFTSRLAYSFIVFGTIVPDITPALWLTSRAQSPSANFQHQSSR